MHRLCVIGSPRGAAKQFDVERVIGSVFFHRVKSGGLSGRVIRNPIASFVIGNGIFLVAFPEIPCNFKRIVAPGGATIEDIPDPVVVECKKKSKSTLAPLQKRTRSVLCNARVNS